MGLVQYWTRKARNFEKEKEKNEIRPINHIEGPSFRDIVGDGLICIYASSK